MAEDSEFEQLRGDVRYLKDRVAILDCVAAHARGCDRHDVALLTGTYHVDGVDVHGVTVNAGSDYAGWVNGVHAATSQNHLHNVTTHSCEIDGDEAHAESYVMVTLLSPVEVGDWFELLGLLIFGAIIGLATAAIFAARRGGAARAAAASA